MEYLGKTFGPEVKLLPGTTAAKTAEIELTTPDIFLSLSTMGKAERAVNASEESKLHVGLDPLFRRKVDSIEHVCILLLLLLLLG